MVILSKTIFISLALLIVASIGWAILGPDKLVVDDNRRAVANIAVNKIAESIYNQNAAHGISRVALLHLENDPSDYVTFALRNGLSATGMFDIEGTSVCEKWNNLLSLRNKGIYNLAEAIDYGKRNDLEGVLIGKIDKFLSIKNGAQIVGCVDMISIKDGRKVFSVKFSEDTSLGIASQVKGMFELAPAAQNELGAISWLWRIIGCAIAILLLPIATISFVRTMVARKSNGTNAFVLCVYTVIDLMFALMMIGGAFASSFHTILFVAAGVCAFLYNIRIMTFALRLEEK